MQTTKPGTYLYDGTKAIPLHAITQDTLNSWWWGTPVEGGNIMGALDAYRAVPWLFRAVDIRARAVAKMPYSLYAGRSKRDLRKDPQYTPLTRVLKRMFFLAEAGLCLYGAGYWTKEDELSPRWLLPTTMTPEFSETQGLTAFTRRVNGREFRIPTRQVLYVWLPNPAGELGPGQAPAAVALRAAGVLHNLDTYLESYFKRGAIKTTLLTVEGNPPKAETDRLEAWWKAMVTGVRKAFQSVAIRSSVKPVVIGDSLRESISPEMTTQAREDVATALGVPHSLLFSNAANYATASQDALGFYTDTIEPEVELIEEQLNELWLAPLGLRIAFRPDMLEIYQQYELQKASAIAAAVGQPVLTVAEGRELLGYDPLPAPELTDSRTNAEMQRGKDAKSISSTANNKEALCDSAPLRLCVDPSSVEDLRRWQRKTLKSLKAGGSAAIGFESEHIAPEVAATIARLLQEAATPDEVKAIFANAREQEFDNGPD
jgi:HK97 family phage portal protein